MRYSLLLASVGILTFAGCSSNGSSGRTEVVPPEPGSAWSDAPLWYNSPTLVTPQLSPSARRERRDVQSQRARLNRDKAYLAAERADFLAEQEAAGKPRPPETGPPKTGPLSSPGFNRSLKDSPQPAPASRPVGISQ